MTEILLEADAHARYGADAPPASLVDLLDRLLGTGVVLAGDVVISLAGVDLVLVHVRALITTVRDHRPDE